MVDSLFAYKTSSIKKCGANDDVDKKRYQQIYFNITVSKQKVGGKAGMITVPL